jgi:hypothetical protein
MCNYFSRNSMKAFKESMPFIIKGALFLTNSISSYSDFGGFALYLSNASFPL